MKASLLAVSMAVSVIATTTSGGCGGSSTAAKTCLTDQQICQFKQGMSTTIDVRNALGSPQQSQTSGNGDGATQQWTYVCQMTDQVTDTVTFVFNGAGILQGITGFRSGPDTKPLPNC